VNDVLICWIGRTLTCLVFYEGRRMFIFVALTLDPIFDMIKFIMGRDFGLTV